MTLTPLLSKKDTTYFCGNIVWLKPAFEIQSHVLLRYRLDNGVYNHPALIVRNGVVEHDLYLNEIEIVLLTTLGGRDAEDYERGKHTDMYLPIAPKKSRSGIPQLCLIKDTSLRGEGYISLRDKFRIDCSMVKQYDKDLPAWYFALESEGYNRIATHFRLRTLTKAYNTVFERWLVEYSLKMSKAGTLSPGDQRTPSPQTQVTASAIVVQKSHLHGTTGVLPKPPPASASPSSAPAMVDAIQAPPSQKHVTMQRTTLESEAILRIIGGLMLALYCIFKGLFSRLVVGKLLRSNSDFAEVGPQATAYTVVARMVSQTTNIISEDWSRATKDAEKEDAQNVKHA